MGPGFKYHIVTISAIFLALTVGLVVGSLFVSPRIANRSERMITVMQKQLGEEVTTLRQRNENYHRWVEAALPGMLRGRLSDANVAIVQTGDYPEAVTAVRAALEMANANVTSVTTIGKSFDRPDGVLVPELAKLHAGDPRFPTAREALALTFAHILANGDSPDRPFIDDLDREGFIRADGGGDYKSPVRFVVLVCGSNHVTNRPSNVDQPLVEALMEENVTVIACEPQNVLDPDSLAFVSLNVPVRTVPAVDTDLGYAALIDALEAGGRATASAASPAKATRR